MEEMARPRVPRERAPASALLFAMFLLLQPACHMVHMLFGVAGLLPLYALVGVGVGGHLLRRGERGAAVLALVTASALYALSLWVLAPAAPTPAGPHRVVATARPPDPARIETLEAELVASMPAATEAQRARRDELVELCEGRPLELAVRLGDQAMVVRLLAAGADPARPNPSGQTPRDLATARGEPELARLLSE